MSVINTNVSAMQAQNSLRSTSLNLSTAMERLSTGTRINSAKDDAAGLAISTRMTASIRGISAAIRNANDGISLTQTAEGSLSQISDNLQRVRELAVQSSNTGNNASDRAAMNNEAKQLIAEIDRVASNTSFNGIKLLDGSFQNQALQVGAGNDSNDRISISVNSAKSSSLGVGSNSSYAAKTTGMSVGATALAAGALNINGFSTGAAMADGVSSTASNTSGIAVAAAINAISAQTNVTATVGQTAIAGQGATGFATAIEAGDVKINGVSIGPISAASTAVGRGGQVSAAVNAVSSQTGVTATFDKTTGAVALSAADGRNISVEAVNAGGANKVTGLGSGTAFSVAGTALTSTEAIEAGTVSINGVDLRAVTGDATGVTTEGVSTATKVTAGGFALSSPTSTFALGSAAPSTETVVFKTLAAGQSATVNGLTFTATNEVLAADVAAAFANVAAGATAATVTSGNTTSAGLGTYSGTNSSTYASGAASTATVIYTSAANAAATFGAPTSSVRTESSAITFSALAAGESATLNGLTFTSTNGATAEQVGKAFANLTSGVAAASVTNAVADRGAGTYSGTFTVGFSTAAAGTEAAGTAGKVTATSSTASSNVTDIALSSTRAAVTETAEITFSALAAGESATLNGLTFTSTNGATAEQVGKAFESLTSTQTNTQIAAANTELERGAGTYSGTFAAGFATAVAGTGTTAGVVTATSSTVGSNVTNISTTGSKALNVAAAVNAVTDQTGVTATASAGAVGLTSNGRAINLTGNDVTTTGIAELTALNTTALTAANTLTNRSTVELSTTDAAGINVSGSTAAALTAAGLTESSATVVTTAGAGVSSIDLTTAAGSQAALTTLDSAINTITNSRAAMGAYQNRLTASISNLESTSMNLSASRSRILDTDYAKETTNLAKAQIISQAATAMLAQANQSGQSVLALLQ